MTAKTVLRSGNMFHHSSLEALQIGRLLAGQQLESRQRATFARGLCEAALRWSRLLVRTIFHAGGSERMTRASIPFAVAALALVFAAPLDLRADDSSPFGGSSPFGKGLDEQKIRDDMAKMRQQIEQDPGNASRQSKDSRFHRYPGSGTKSSSREKTRVQKNLSERARSRRDSQRDRQVTPQGSKRSTGRSSSRGSSDSDHAS